MATKAFGRGILWGVCLVVHVASGAGISRPDIRTVVIDHVPAATQIYLGSPSIVIMPNGSYVASHDYFGPGSSEDTTGVFRSEDRGQTWRKIAVIKGQFWSTLFIHRKQLFLLGTSRRFGHIVIRRSTDGGATWTSPASANSGRLTSENHYHCAPTPVIEYQGRLWRAFEDTRRAANGGQSFQALVVSTPADADLLTAANWTLSSPLPGNTGWLGGKFDGWLEGNAVVDRSGRLLDILRVRFTSGPEKAAFVQVSPDGSPLAFDPTTGFHDFPGGAKKFTIRFDRQTRLYWTLANTIPEPKPPGRIDLIRNTLTLNNSPDLVHWTERAVLLHHPDPKFHAFQYVDWQFDGADIIAAVRTANDDASGGAHNGHDANYFTFLRVAGFRDLKAGLPEPAASFETRDLSISGSGFTIDTLSNGQTAFSNRKYIWQGIPEKYSGWRYTKTAGGSRSTIRVRAKHDAILQMITATEQPGADLTGWERTGVEFRYSDEHHTKMVLCLKPMASGKEVEIPQGNWTGSLVLFPD